MSSTLLVAGVFAACTGRPLPAADDGGATPDGFIGGDARVPAEQCRSDVQCPSGHECRCMPDPSCPMCSVCLYACVPAGPCQDTAAPLKVSLGKRGEEVWVRLRNTGCKSLYRLEGCCGEGEPQVEQLLGGGGWGPADCVRRPEACCAALPSCVELPSGSEREFRLHDLERCKDCKGTFRAAFDFFDAPGCPPTMDRPLLRAISEAIVVTNSSCGD